jgi:chemotaxis protein MotB
MRRRRHIEEAPDKDRWLVSYSDFMTLLFALFVVLFASSYRDNQMIKKISQAIQVGFQQLGASSGGASKAGVAYPSLITDSTPVTLSSHAQNQSKENASGSSPVDVVALRKELESAIGTELRNDEIEMRVTPEGFVVSLRELGFFNSGQAVLLPGAEPKIEKIGKVLSKRGLELRIEGHSDDQPIHTAQFQSNWELSTARAMAVLLLLVNDSGFDPHRISVVGYGQYRPLADNATPDGRRINRRVDMVVVGTVPTKPSPVGKPSA